MLTSTPATQCRRCHRTFCSLPPVPSSSWTWNEAQPAHSEVCHSHPKPSLPDFSHRHYSPVQLCRPVQYPPPPADPHNPGLPAPPHLAPEPHRGEMGPSQGPCLYAFHHLIH